MAGDFIELLIFEFGESFPVLASLCVQSISCQLSLYSPCTRAFITVSAQSVHILLYRTQLIPVLIAVTVRALPDAPLVRTLFRDGRQIDSHATMRSY